MTNLTKLLSARDSFEDSYLELKRIQQLLSEIDEFLILAHNKLNIDNDAVKSNLYEATNRISASEKDLRKIEASLDRNVSLLSEGTEGFSKRIFEADVEKMTQELISCRLRIREANNQLNNLRGLLQRKQIGCQVGRILKGILIGILIYYVFIVIIVFIFCISESKRQKRKFPESKESYKDQPYVTKTSDAPATYSEGPKGFVFMMTKEHSKRSSDEKNGKKSRRNSTSESLLGDFNYKFTSDVHVTDAPDPYPIDTSNLQTGNTPDLHAADTSEIPHTNNKNEEATAHLNEYANPETTFKEM